jgi:hypothetical protein
MHIENELAEIVTTGDQEYEEIVEEYEEEILVPEEVPELSLTDHTDTPSAQGKPRCITFILIITEYIYCAFMLQEFYETHMHIYTPMSLTSTGSASCYA